MTSFTPGPWHVDPDHPRAWILEADGGKVAYISLNPSQFPETDGSTRLGPEREANARLIAAAPEMYAELEAVLAACTDGRDQITNLMEWAYRIDTVMARARGEATS